MSTSSSSEPYDLQEASGHLVRRAQQRHTRLWGRLVGEQLTSPQYAVLHVLGGRAGLDLTELGERAALDRTTVGRVVARLGDEGLVATMPGPTDRRRRLVALTDLGRARLAEIAPAAAEVSDRLLDGLDAHDAGLLLDLLRRVVAADDTVDDDAEDDPAEAGATSVEVTGPAAMTATGSRP